MTVIISFDRMSEQQILNIAYPIMDNLMEASTHITNRGRSRIENSR